METRGKNSDFEFLMFGLFVQEFILNTPDIEAIKVWSGNMGQTATDAIVFAQLLTADRKNRGLHAFIVPIRNRKTLLPFPGVLVGDMGPKLGLNGIDNGWVVAFCVKSHPRDCAVRIIFCKENVLHGNKILSSLGDIATSICSPFLPFGQRTSCL